MVSVEHPYTFDRDTDRWPDGLWSCPGCGRLRSDAPWEWTRDSSIAANAHHMTPAMVALLATWPTLFYVCRDCNISWFFVGERAAFILKAKSYASLSKERMDRVRRKALLRARKAYIGLRPATIQKANEINDRAAISRIVRQTETYNLLVEIDQIWHFNHPQNYPSTWDRMSEVSMPESEFQKHHG